MACPCIETCDQILVPVSLLSSPALDSTDFCGYQTILKNWLKNPKLPGKDMDSVNFTPERFEVLIDTRGYNPEDIQCKVGPNLVELVCERVEAAGNTQRKTATTRNYQIPEPVDPLNTLCCLSSDGILLITAPWQK